MTIEPREVLSLVSDADLLVEVRRRNLLGKPVPRVCAYCGGEYTATGRNQKYCTPVHRYRAALLRGERVPSVGSIEREAQRVRKRRTPEQVERHRQQQRAWYERKKGAA